MTGEGGPDHFRLPAEKGRRDSFRDTRPRTRGKDPTPTDSGTKFRTKGHSRCVPPGSGTRPPFFVSRTWVGPQGTRPCPTPEDTLQVRTPSHRGRQTASQYTSLPVTLTGPTLGPLEVVDALWGRGITCKSYESTGGPRSPPIRLPGLPETTGTGSTRQTSPLWRRIPAGLLASRNGLQLRLSPEAHRRRGLHLSSVPGDRRPSTVRPRPADSPKRHPGGTRDSGRTPPRWPPDKCGQRRQPGVRSSR